jgi:hypothetical protein
VSLIFYFFSGLGVGVGLVWKMQHEELGDLPFHQGAGARERVCDTDGDIAADAQQTTSSRREAVFSPTSGTATEQLATT